MRKRTATTAVNKILLQYMVGNRAVVKRVVQMGLSKFRVDINIFCKKLRRRQKKILQEFGANIVQA